MFTYGGVAIKYKVLSGVACFSHPRGLIYAPPCQEIYHLPTFVAHVLFHSIYILGLNINMRITATTVALLLHHAATAHKASKAPAKGSKSKKGKTGKGTAAPTGALCFNDTSIRQAVADYFGQDCPTEPNCEIISQYGGIGGWKTCEVTDMSELFDDYKHPEIANFNESLNNWDVSKVTTMADMFNGAAAYNQPMNDWDVSKVTTMNNMFYAAAAYNQPMDDWDVSKVTDMKYMFEDAAAYNQNLCAWGTKLQATAVDFMFDGSGCTYTNTPDLSLAPPGPFCAADCSVVFV